MIAISVGATLLFTRNNTGDNPPTATGIPTSITGTASDIASANDTGPVSVITEDPTCEPSRPIISTLAKQQRQGWTDRDYTLPGSSWTPEQRAMHDVVADAMRRAADQMVALARMTPHRVMRELYEQSIAFWRAYADSIPTYTAKDNALAAASSDAAGAIVSICAAIDYHSAASRGPLVPPVSPPSSVPPVGDPGSPTPFLTASDSSVCTELLSAANKFDADVERWRDSDPNIPASQWTPGQRSLMDSVGPIMTKFADDLERLGRNSDNPTLTDIAALSAQYWRAFVQAIPSYVAVDNYLSSTASYTEFLIVDACESVGSLG